MFLSKESNGIYYLFLSNDLGKRCKVSTRCRCKADALRFYQSFKLHEHERKTNLTRVSLSQFKLSYIEHSKSVHTPSTTENGEPALNMLQAFIGDQPLHKKGVREIELFLAERRQKRSVWNARNYYICLSAAFEKAGLWGHVLCNPFREVAKPRVPELQPVFFSRTDFCALMKAIDDSDFQELVLTAVSTGMREGELLALRWDWVDLCRNVITVKNTDDFTTKNKRSRVGALTDTLCKLLLERRESATSETALAFHSSGGKLTKDQVFKRYVTAAGLDKRLHFHSLRHTFGSWLAMDGVSLYAIQKLLGHSTATVTQVYSHPQPEQLHDTLNSISLLLN